MKTILESAEGQKVVVTTQVTETGVIVTMEYGASPFRTPQEQEAVAHASLMRTIVKAGGKVLNQTKE